MSAQQRLAKVRGRLLEVAASGRGSADSVWQGRIAAARERFEEGMGRRFELAESYRGGVRPDSPCRAAFEQWRLEA